jgi:CRP/FNR family transcriptional regulator
MEMSRVILQTDLDRVQSALPFLARLESDLRQEFVRDATLSRIPVGKDVLVEGDRVEGVPLLISGEIRVYRIGESGREITLYRFGQGECCVLSADSILGNRLFPACARAEEEVEVVFIPARVFDSWLGRSSAWRRFVFEAMAKRLLSLMDTLDAVAFSRMDARVATLLGERSGERKTTIRITHQEIADELGSSREVISRILEGIQARGQIRLTRGTVEILAPESLSKSGRL